MCTNQHATCPELTNRLPPKIEDQTFSTDKLKELTTSSESPTIDKIEEEGTESTAEHSYIIFDNNTIDKLADEVVIEVNSDKVSADFNTVLAEVLIVPWIGQEWLEFMSALLFIASKYSISV